ncbi:hypothetical protein G9A89_001148 [Geosiphon pyriformis]|nr:hypothetical protein G9A89_001148 [Geosiphon pyriformis]
MDNSFDGIAKKFQIIDGRRYHNLENAKYFGANDDGEAFRLEEFHFTVKKIWNGNYLSPIDEILKAGAKVLDVGCGPGTWVIEMARTYPRSEFIGIDISPIFPTKNLPPNVRFLECNLLDGLPMENDTLDFVFQRFLVGGYTEEQWKTQVIQELARVTRPGGWIELTEADITSPSDGEVTQRLNEAVTNFMKSKGMNPCIGEDLRKIVENTGMLTNIKSERLKIPIGKPGGQIGEESLIFLMRAWASSKAPLRAYMNITPEHFDAFVETLGIEADKRHTEMRHYKVFGKKGI